MSWQSDLRVVCDASVNAFLIMDRDAKYTEEFRDFLDREGVKPVRFPGRAPKCNTNAERFIRLIKEECLNCIVLSERAHYVGHTVNI
jgi:hypothetical protein